MEDQKSRESENPNAQAPFKTLLPSLLLMSHWLKKVKWPIWILGVRKETPHIARAWMQGINIRNSPQSNKNIHYRHCY